MSPPRLGKWRDAQHGALPVSPSVSSETPRAARSASRASARASERAPAPTASRPSTARTAAAKKPRTSNAKCDPPSPPNKRSAKPAPTPADALHLPAGLRLTHGERVIDAASGCTKLDLMRYYDSVADRLLPHLKGRPVAMLRAPAGIDAALFFQRHGGQGFAGIRTLDAALWPGHAPLLEIGSRKALLGAVQMNAVEFHTWNVKVRHFDRPDRIVFDLDPGKGVGWPAIREGAELLRALLLELKLHSWPKTSGGNGLHLVVPIAPRWRVDTVRSLAQAVVAHLARTVPQRFVAKSGAARRIGRIFVDYLRNGEGATTVAAFSARARRGLGVSMPLSWDELPSLRSASPWTIANAGQRLQQGDVWAGAMKQRQSIDAAMRALGIET
jgi:bifunctional non-homologous end joining protein LigD